MCHIGMCPFYKPYLIVVGVQPMSFSSVDFKSGRFFGTRSKRFIDCFFFFFWSRSGQLGMKRKNETPLLLLLLLKLVSISRSFLSFVRVHARPDLKSTEEKDKLPRPRPKEGKETVNETFRSSAEETSWFEINWRKRHWLDFDDDVVAPLITW